MMGDKIAAKDGDGGARRAAGARLRRRGAGPCRRPPRVAERDRLSGADQGGRRRRRARHEGGASTPAGSRRRSASPAPRRAPASATTRSTSRNTSTGRATSSCRCWPTSTATSCISASATAACSAGTRSCWRRPARPVLTAAMRDAARRDRDRRRCAELGYRNAGTLEFLYQDGQFAFIEMNTRLQVEHPVTEMVCGIDLVREQIRIAAGDAARLRRRRTSRFTGHAIECRINAEDPETLRALAGPGHRVPRAGRPGRARRFRAVRRLSVPPYYDSLIAKLIVHAPDPRRGDRPHAPRPGRVRRGRHPDHDPAAPRASSTTRTSRPATTRSTGWNASSPKVIDGNHGGLKALEFPPAPSRQILGATLIAAGATA